MTFQKAFNAKTVIITGHTGFKGTWLTAWLKQLGAKIVGIALDPPTEPSHFVAAQLADGMVDLRIDIRNQVAIEEAIVSAQPDFVFHLAAQALVRRSYEDPVETWQTNLLGTLHVLETLRKLDKPCAAVIITSDKCYDNVEWVWGYRETDAMGGPDPYSASKGAAELAIRSHIKSYFPKATSKIRIAVGRAGNVIGGGDWASDRIVPDCIRSWEKGETVQLRNPQAIRPWQHVLESLRGYLTLATQLSQLIELHGEPFNFGPQMLQNHTVIQLVQSMSRYWDKVRWEDISCDEKQPYESGSLKLNSDKALHYLNWKTVLNFQETVKLTAEWYKNYYSDPQNIMKCTTNQIEEYNRVARNTVLL